jgi:hypothetical protein
MPYVPKSGRYAPTGGPPPELRVAAGTARPPRADKPAVPIAPARGPATAAGADPPVRAASILPTLSVANHHVDPDHVLQQLFGRKVTVNEYTGVSDILVPAARRGPT